MREYLITLQKRVIAGIKADAINSRDILVETRQFVKDMASILDNEGLALVSIIDTELDRGEKEMSTIIKIMESMEVDIDAASEINFMLISSIVSMQIRNLNAAIENSIAALNTLNAIRVKTDQ